jgi:hypothetical protein
MTPEEFKAIRTQLGLNRAEFGAELGYSGSGRNDHFLIGQYERGLKTIPAYIARLAFLLLEHYNAEDQNLPEWPPSCAHLPPKPEGEKRR